MSAPNFRKARFTGSGNAVVALDTRIGCSIKCTQAYSCMHLIVQCIQNIKGHD